MQCFALETGSHDVTDLGFAEVLDDGDARIAPALYQPFWKGKSCRRWIRRQHRSLDNIGIELRAEPLARGWLRLRMSNDETKGLIILVPPFRAQKLSAIRFNGKMFELVPVQFYRHINELQLPRLFKERW